MVFCLVLAMATTTRPQAAKLVVPPGAGPVDCRTPPAAFLGRPWGATAPPAARKRLFGAWPRDDPTVVRWPDAGI